jgi:hypothetical protein
MNLHRNRARGISSALPRALRCSLLCNVTKWRCLVVFQLSTAEHGPLRLLQQMVTTFCSLRHWIQLPDLIIAPSPTAVYVVNKRPLIEVYALLAISENLRSAPHSLMTTSRMNLISARSISLDGTFKLIT